VRNPERIDIVVAKLEKVWKQYPDMRLGQLVINAVKLAGNFEDQTFNAEEDVIMYGLNQLDKDNE
jgi:uncharacterized protein YihD (DUF1040 family)